MVRLYGPGGTRREVTWTPSMGPWPAVEQLLDAIGETMCGGTWCGKDIEGWMRVYDDMIDSITPLRPCCTAPAAQAGRGRITFVGYGAPTPDNDKGVYPCRMPVCHRDLGGAVFSSLAARLLCVAPLANSPLADSSPHPGRAAGRDWVRQAR
jgi:hypothetical protein